MKELLTYNFYSAFLKRVFFILFCSCIYTQLFTQVTASLPVDPFIRNYVTSPLVEAKFNLSSGSYYAKISGKITRLSPVPFTITSNTGYQRDLYSGPIVLTSDEKDNAFGFFIFDNLAISGIDQTAIADPSGIRVGKLPDGNYSICFTARNLQNDSLLASHCNNFTISCGVLINTIATPPVNPIISKSITDSRIHSTIQIRNPQQCNTTVQVKLFGKIERLAPSSFSIALNPNYQQQTSITLNTGVTQLSPSQMLAAFNNFNESNLITNGVNLASIKDANNNIKLPDGSYRICFYARYIDPSGALGSDASDPNLGCGSFTICNKAGGSPQFTQPVNNTNINSEIAVIQPISPVIFSWLPPQSTCGLPPTGYTYDLEIWELYPNQTVTDAVNNPFVFRKTSLPSTTFLLDINLYKDVLKLAKRYAMRVRAISINPNSPVEIDNDGYSRIEAFQYGASLITQNGVPDPHDYFIPLDERKSSFWDDVYRANQQRKRSDTLVPIKEYIAFALTQNGIAYSLDAIELFLALNHELADVKKVNISYNPKLPVFPLVLANDQKNFEKEHQVNLEPDKAEENKFLKYLDTLNNYNQKIPTNAVKMINDLVSHLNSIKTQVSSVDRVTVNFINDVLSELLYELRAYSRNLTTSQYNQLQKLVTMLQELTTESLTSTSFFYLSPEKTVGLFRPYQAGPNGYTSNISMAGVSHIGVEVDSLEYIPAVAIAKQLLPFDVIVWRTGTVAPFKPVLDAPDLKATFRVFYTLSDLYNHKNPEVNAKTGSRLASTIGISLPSNSTFSFWTLNMVNHRMTNAKDIDPRDVLKNSMKNEPRLKKPSIVLKVD